MFIQYLRVFFHKYGKSKKLIGSGRNIYWLFITH